MSPTHYTDLEIRIQARQAHGYPVEITLDGRQEFPRGYLDATIADALPSAMPARMARACSSCCWPMNGCATPGTLHAGSIPIAPSASA